MLFQSAKEKRHFYLKTYFSIVLLVSSSSSSAQISADSLKSDGTWETPLFVHVKENNNILSCIFQRFLSARAFFSPPGPNQRHSVPFVKCSLLLSFDKPLSQAEINISFIFLCTIFSGFVVHIFKVTQRGVSDLRSFWAVSYPKILQNSNPTFHCGVSLGRMGGWKENGRSRLGRTKLKEKKSGWTFSLTQSQVSQLCLGEKRRKLETITAFGSPPGLFLSLNCDWGVFLLQLFIIFSTKIFGFFLWKEDNWLGGGRWLQSQLIPALRTRVLKGIFVFHKGFIKYLLLKECKSTKWKCH